MSQAYSPLNVDTSFHDEHNHHDLKEEWRAVEDEAEHLKSGCSRCSGNCIWIIHVVLLCMSLTLSTSAYFANASTLRYTQRFSAYSPAASAVKYEGVRFNLSMGSMSPYVGYGPAVDRAWRTISYDMGDQMITPEELDILEMPKSSLKVEHPKTGIAGYRVTYKEWYWDIAGDLKDPEMLRMHTDHCLEVLRLNIQCNADIGLFTFYMKEGDPLPWPELNSKHMCRNFDKVLDWAMTNSVGNMEKDIEINA